MNNDQKVIQNSPALRGGDLITEALAIAERILRTDGLGTVGVHGEQSSVTPTRGTRWCNVHDGREDIVRTEIIVPLRLNDGTPLGPSELASIYVEIARAFGGMTVWACHGLAIGARAELDESLWIVSLFPKRLLCTMKQLARTFEDRFDQREIFWFTSPARRHGSDVAEGETVSETAAE